MMRLGNLGSSLSIGIAESISAESGGRSRGTTGQVGSASLERRSVFLWGYPDTLGAFGGVSGSTVGNASMALGDDGILGVSLGASDAGSILGSGSIPWSNERTIGGNEAGDVSMLVVTILASIGTKTDVDVGVGITLNAGVTGPATVWSTLRRVTLV